jgi:hypothetical protein
MSARPLVFTLGALLAFPGCLAPEEQLESSQLELVGEPSPAGVTPRGVYVITPPELVGPPGDIVMAAGEPRIIYMNKDGGTYTPGYNDSSQNRSSIVNSTRTVPAWNVSASGWEYVLSCVQDVFSEFNVIVTDQDPGNVTHVESVVAGHPNHIGMQNGVGGVSPFSCGMIEKSIVFTFAQVYGNNYQEICHTAAQEIAHSYGLDHEYLCSDPMTYLGGCGKKSFQDVNAPCGEYSQRQCQCGGSTQNSVQLLLQRLGPGDTLAPVVSIDAPQNGAVVAPGFDVAVTAEDDTGISRVELLIDGALADTNTAAPWGFTTDPNLAEGAHTLEVRAYDSVDTMASDTISVTVQADDPTDPTDPNDDPMNPPINPGDTGSPCTDGGECNSGICATSGDGGHCTEFCDPATAGDCPDGFACTSTSGGDSVCWPDGDGGGGSPDGPPNVAGGCQSSGGGAAGLALILGCVALALRRRRATER